MIIILWRNLRIAISCSKNSLENAGSILYRQYHMHTFLPCMKMLPCMKILPCVKILPVTIPCQPVSIACSNIYTHRKRKVNYCCIALMRGKECNLLIMAQLVGEAYISSFPAPSSCTPRKHSPQPWTENGNDHSCTFDKVWPGTSHCTDAQTPQASQTMGASEHNPL